MPTRTIPVITKLTAESSAQSWEMGLAQRISVLDPTAPPHFPCHIVGTSTGLVVSHGADMVAIPWAVFRTIWEQANPKLVPTAAPANKNISQGVKEALSEAAKLPKTP